MTDRTATAFWVGMAPDPDHGAREFWLERARSVPGPLAVQPGGRWVGIHEWSRRMLREWTLSRLDRPRFGRIADLGCGRGDWTEAFAGRADEMFACDVAPPFVEQTRARLAAIDHPAWEVECCDLRDYTIPLDLDVAYFGAVLIYFIDATAIDLLASVRRAMTRNGLVIVRDWCTYNLGLPAVYVRNGFSIHRRPSEIVRFAEHVGLRTLEVRSAPSIYTDQTSARFTRWPMRAAWWLATAYRLRTSYTFIFRAP